ncbi:MAG: NUDIX hydrolase [Ardenticatenia bacterium]|nr:NUDIX hydrolase [Ardenticatenia bacterium]
MKRWFDASPWTRLLLPFWRRAPLGVRRRLIWLGSSKFLVGVAAVCVNPKGRILVLEHRFHNEYPWGLPGGWLERGETPLACVVREVVEETGLQPEVLDVLWVEGDGEWVEICYLCRVPDAMPVIQLSEIKDYRWVDPIRPDVALKPSQAWAVRLATSRLHEAVSGVPHVADRP